MRKIGKGERKHMVNECGLGSCGSRATPALASRPVYCSINPSDGGARAFGLGSVFAFRGGVNA